MGSRGIVPVYVGQARKSFGRECLGDHKLTHLNSELVKRKGTPVLFLVALVNGPSKRVSIIHVEHFLTRKEISRPSARQRGWPPKVAEISHVFANEG